MNHLPKWVENLSSDDLEFILQFLLLSGSLKDLAKHYGISYPTIRLRLDRIIEQVAHYAKPTELSPLEESLHLMAVRGEINKAIAERILKAHKATLGRV